MAEFMKVVRDYNRMCSAHDNCRECPINGYSCNVSEFDENSEAIVEQWAAEHPVKTNRDALREVFPQYSESMTGRCPFIFSIECVDCEFFNNAQEKRKCTFWDSEYEGGVNNG